ncbi:MAG: Uma2 family endonuclease [Ktedonobacterales bacterium]
MALRKRSDMPAGDETMTYDAFLEWADEDTLAEWVDGRVVMNSPANFRHQDIINFLLEVLRTYVRIHDLGKIADGPFQMKLGRSGREPDILFVTRAHLDRLKPTYLDGPADLVIEVVAPESAARDRGDKFYEYREAGIPEYWLIDPNLEQAEFYQLDEAGRYQTAVVAEDGAVHSRAVASFWLRVEWLWQDPLPEASQALLEIDPEGYGAYLKDRLRRAGL